MNATRFTILGALAASLLLVPACDDKKAAADDKKAADGKDKKDDAKKDDAKKDDAKKDDAKEGDAKEGEAKPADAAAEGGAEAAGAAETIGVAICDEYIEKYGKCIEDNAPDNMKTQMKDALAKSAERFKKQSEGPEKDTLEQSCTAALEAVKKTSKGWGCTYE
jgi:hypothetical protein